MCIGEAPPFRVDAKLVLSKSSTKRHRYRRAAKETAMISAHRDSNCTVRPGRHSCTLGSAMQRQLQHCGRSVHDECRDSVQGPGLVVLASAFAPVPLHISGFAICTVWRKRPPGKQASPVQATKQAEEAKGGTVPDDTKISISTFPSTC